MFVILIILAIALGIFAGSALPIIPYTYSIYLSIGILAALDSVFGALASIVKKRFDFKIFITGLFGNAILAMFLTFLGIKLNIDVYIGIIVVFVTRMFNNLAIIRRDYIESWANRYEKAKKTYLTEKTDIEYYRSNQPNFKDE